MVVSKVMNFPKRDLMKTINQDSNLLTTVMRANKIQKEEEIDDATIE